MIATLVCVGLDMLEVVVGIKAGGREEEKAREGAEVKRFLCAAVEGLGFCWNVEVTATERLRLDRRGVKKGRRKAEENSLKVDGIEKERLKGCENRV